MLGVMHRLSLAAAAVLSLLACEAGPGAPSDVALGVEFTLAPGQSALAGGDGLHVTFDSVIEDSRCPMDAICITAGQVVVDVRAGRRVVQRYSLTPDQTLAVDGFRLGLVRVEPYPAVSSPITPSQYRATFVVDRP